MIVERVYGKDHRRAADVLADLGGLCRAAGDFAKARELHERALMIVERIHGKYHGQVAKETLRNVPVCYYVVLM